MFIETLTSILWDRKILMLRALEPILTEFSQCSLNFTSVISNRKAISWDYLDQLMLAKVSAGGIMVSLSFISEMPYSLLKGLGSSCRNIYSWMYNITFSYTLRSTEAELMRLFFELKSSRVRDSAVVKTDVDNTSCLSSCHIGKTGKKSCGTVKNSVLCNVRCNYIDADGCILINVTADSIIAKSGSVIYNIVDESSDGLDVNNGQVLAGVFSSDGSQMLMKSTTNIDGGRAWERQLEWNPKTFEDVYNMNTDANPIDLERWGRIQC